MWWVLPPPAACHDTYQAARRFDFGMTVLARGHVPICMPVATWGVPAYLERSRSGNGGHVWIFFEKPVPAVMARPSGPLALPWSATAMPFFGDRLFPTRTLCRAAASGNLIASLQVEPSRGVTASSLAKTLEPYPDQWRFLLLRGVSLKARRPESHRPRPKTPSAVSCLSHPKRKTVGETTALPTNLLPRSQRYKSHSRICSTYQRLGWRCLRSMPSAVLPPSANPDFIVLQPCTRAFITSRRIIYAARDEDGFVGLPRGCKDALIRLVETAGASYELDDRREHGRKIDVAFTGTLRSEQQQAVNAPSPMTTAFSPQQRIRQDGRRCLPYCPAPGQHARSFPPRPLERQWRERLLDFLDVRDELPDVRTKTGRKSRKVRSVVGQIGGGKNLPSGIIDGPSLHPL